MDNLLYRCLVQKKKKVSALYFRVINGTWVTSYIEGPIDKIWSFEKVYAARPVGIWDDGQDISRFSEAQLKELLRA